MGTPRILYGAPTLNPIHRKHLPAPEEVQRTREGKMFFTMKLPIEEKKGLYCTWIRQDERPGAPLVALWIDPAMSAFADRAIAGSGTVSEELRAYKEG